MNKGFISGIFRKISYKAEGSFFFSIGARRDYKNKETGKYEYDNATFYAPKYATQICEFMDRYIKDGDTVEVEYHIGSYVSEKDGEKVYHEDHICDAIRILKSKEDSAAGQKAESEPKTKASKNETEEVEVDDEDCPW